MPKIKKLQMCGNKHDSILYLSKKCPLCKIIKEKDVEIKYLEHKISSMSMDDMAKIYKGK